MDNITKTYKKYKLKETKETMKDFCFPKKFELQPQQQFLPEYLWDNKKTVNGLLVFHQIGSGKTCTAINIAEKFKSTMNIMVVLPAALVGNFKDELRTKCPGDEVYIKEHELKKLKESDNSDIKDKSEERISKYYTIYSYHKFVYLVKENKIKLKNTLLIRD